MKNFDAINPRICEIKIGISLKIQAGLTYFAMKSVLISAIAWNLPVNQRCPVWSGLDGNNKLCLYIMLYTIYEC